MDVTQAVWVISQSAGTLNLGSGGLTVTGAGNSLPLIDTTVSLPLAQTWTIGGNMVATAFKTVSGSGALTKSGSGTLVLHDDSNSFTGAITIAQGKLSVGSVANGGSNSALGAGGAAASNLKFDGGTLEYTGLGDATNRQFTVSPNGATILNNSSGDLYFNSTAALTYSGSGPRTLTLGGSASTFGTQNTGKLAASIADGPGGATSIVKTGSDVWLLTGNASYTGGTTVLSGVLGVSGDHSAAKGAIVLAGGRIEVADRSKIGGDVVIRRQTGFQASQSGTAAAQTNSPNFFGDSPEEFEIEGDLTFEEESELDMGLEWLPTRDRLRPDGCRRQRFRRRRHARPFRQRFHPQPRRYLLHHQQQEQ